MNNKEIIETIHICFNKYFKNANPNLKIHLNDINIDSTYDIYSNLETLFLQLNIYTNNKHYIEKKSKSFSEFSGYLLGYFEDILKKPIKVKYTFTLVEPLADPYYYNISLSKLTCSGYVSINSLFYKKMKKYNLNSVRMIENKIVGPGIGLFDLLEHEIEINSINTMADLFAGSLAYSLVANSLGVKQIDAYDIIENKHNEKHIKFFKKNLLEFEVEDKYDLIIIDPPQSLHADFLESFLKKKREKTIILFRAGSSFDQNRIAIIDNIILNSNWKYEKFELYKEYYYRLEYVNE